MEEYKAESAKKFGASRLRIARFEFGQTGKTKRGTEASVDAMRGILSDCTSPVTD